MRAHVHRAEFIDEVFGVIAAIGAERDRSRPVSMGLDHGERGDPLRMAVGFGQAGIDDKAGAVLHQRMAQKRQSRLHTRPLAIEPGVRIGERVDDELRVTRISQFRREALGQTAELEDLAQHHGAGIAGQMVVREQSDFW